jgi:hypothetical protein
MDRLQTDNEPPGSTDIEWPEPADHEQADHEHDEWYICGKCRRPVRVAANQCGWCGTWRQKAA